MKKIKKLRKKIKSLKAEVADAHAFAYNMIPNRSDDLEPTLDDQLQVINLWIKLHTKRLKP